MSHDQLSVRLKITPERFQGQKLIGKMGQKTETDDTVILAPLLKAADISLEKNQVVSPILFHGNFQHPGG